MDTWVGAFDQNEENAFLVNDVYFKVTHILGHYVALLDSQIMTLTQPCEPCQSPALVLHRESISGTQEIYLCQILINDISHSVCLNETFSYSITEYFYELCYLLKLSGLT